MQTIVDRFNLGIKRRVSFINNGKTMQFVSKAVIKAAVPSGQFDHPFAPDLDIDSNNVIHCVLRRGGGHNTGLDGYIAHFTITWNGSGWDVSDYDTVRAADATWLLIDPSITILTYGANIGRMLVTYGKMNPAANSQREVWYTYKDPGGDWAAEQKLTSDFAVPGQITGPCRAIQLPNGRLIKPMYARADGSAAQRKIVLYYHDDGATTGPWSHLTDVTGQVAADYEEPSLLRRSDGLLLCGIRSDPNTTFSIVTSTSSGATWGSPAVKFTSHGKNPMAQTPNGTIFTLGRDPATAELVIGTPMVAWSANGGSSFTAISNFETPEEIQYGYGGVVWHPGIAKIVFVWCAAPKTDPFSASTEIRLQVWEEINA